MLCVRRLQDGTRDHSNTCRKRGRDGTKYSRFHPSNFLSHHLAGIVTATVYADARHIEDSLNDLKMRAHALPASDAAAA